MMMLRPSELYASKKGQWRTDVKRVTVAVDKIAERHIDGQHIPMMELYDMGYRIVGMGDRGIDLRARMKEFDVKQKQKVHQSIAATCKMLESAAKIIEFIAERQDIPMIEFPVFVSNLETNARIETDALAALDELKKEVEGG